MSEQTPSIYSLFDGLDRQGPGSLDDTRRAWALVAPRLPPSASPPRIVDMGSGTGAATQALVAVTEGYVTAVERHRPFVARLDAWCSAQGLSDRVTTVVGDMGEPPFADRTFDVVWSEGAAYAIGFERALRRWRRLLVDGGCLAVSELVWRVDSPPAEAKAFFEQAYSDMTTVEKRRALAVDCGYAIIDDFMVSEAGWSEHYYDPLAANVDRLLADAVDDPALREICAGMRREIDIYRNYSETYGYLFLVLQRSPAEPEDQADGPASYTRT